MSMAHAVYHSWRDYLALEGGSNVKHEYLDGQIYAMAGGTPAHAALQATLAGLLFAQLRGGACRALGSDLRVRVLATGLATYPDVTVVCGPRQVDPEDPNSVTNPTLIVEVLSDSTEAYDRGERFSHYRRIETLRHYVLVAQASRTVDVWTLAERGAWACVTYREGDVAVLGAVGASLDVRELYEAAVEGRA